jgi:hypothetical protein
MGGLYGTFGRGHNTMRSLAGAREVLSMSGLRLTLIWINEALGRN